MNQSFKRIIAALLCCLTLSLMLAACGNNNGGDTTTAAPSADTTPQTAAETQVNAQNILGPRDFGKDTITYFTRSYSGEWTSDLLVEEISGDLISDAIYRRNSAIEQQYNVTIGELKSGAVSFYSKVASLVSTSDDSFDVILTSFRDASYLSTSGVLQEVHDLPNLNIDASWWSPFLTEQISIGEKNYYITGEITTVDNVSVRCLYYNKTMLGAIDGTVNLQKMVDDNTWTIENMLRLASNAGADKNGDGKREIGTDAFGLLAEATLGYQLLMGAGELAIAKDADDLPYISIDNSRALEVVDFITGIISTDPAVTTDKVVSDNFVNGDILFILAVLDRVKDFRQIELDYGILPLPKYNADQLEYYCYSDAYCPLAICFPTTVQGDRLDAATFLTEALACESVQTVTPDFYEVCIKTKLARDPEASRMIDIILNNYKMDLVDVFLNPWGFRSVVQNAITAGQSMTTVVKTSGKSVEAKIKQTVDALAALKD